MKDLIKRRLEETRQEIERLQKKVSQEPKAAPVTKNLVPPGVPEVGEDTNKIEPNIPGYITGGPKASKKRKEV